MKVPFGRAVLRRSDEKPAPLSCGSQGQLAKHPPRARERNLSKGKRAPAAGPGLADRCHRPGNRNRATIRQIELSGETS